MVRNQISTVFLIICSLVVIGHGFDYFKDDLTGSGRSGYGPIGHDPRLFDGPRNHDPRLYDAGSDSGFDGDSDQFLDGVGPPGVSFEPINELYTN